MKKGTVFTEPGKPLRFEASEDSDAPRTPDQTSAAVIATALKAYCTSARGLRACLPSQVQAAVTAEILASNVRTCAADQAAPLEVVIPRPFRPPAIERSEAQPDD